MEVTTSFCLFPQCGHPSSFLEDDFCLGERVRQVTPAGRESQSPSPAVPLPQESVLCCNPCFPQQMTLNQAFPDCLSPSITVPSLPHFLCLPSCVPASEFRTPCVMPPRWWLQSNRGFQRLPERWWILAEPVVIIFHNMLKSSHHAVCLNVCSDVCQLFLNKTEWGKPSGEAE